MDRPAAIAALPEVYRAAIALREQGSDAQEIARVLEIEVTAVEPLLEIGDKKLTRLLAEPQPLPQPCDPEPETV